MERHEVLFLGKLVFQIYDFTDALVGSCVGSVLLSEFLEFLECISGKINFSGIRILQVTEDNSQKAFVDIVVHRDISAVRRVIHTVPRDTNARHIVCNLEAVPGFAGLVAEERIILVDIVNG